MAGSIKIRECHFCAGTRRRRGSYHVPAPRGAALNDLLDHDAAVAARLEEEPHARPRSRCSGSPRHPSGVRIETQRGMEGHAARGGDVCEDHRGGGTGAEGVWGGEHAAEGRPEESFTGEEEKMHMRWWWWGG